MQWTEETQMLKCICIAFLHDPNINMINIQEIKEYKKSQIVIIW